MFFETGRYILVYRKFSKLSIPPFFIRLFSKKKVLYLCAPRVFYICCLMVTVSTKYHAIYTKRGFSLVPLLLDFLKFPGTSNLNKNGTIKCVMTDKIKVFFTFFNDIIILFLFFNWF